jgi:hypothetical protein
MALKSGHGSLSFAEFDSVIFRPTWSLQHGSQVSGTGACRRANALAFFAPGKRNVGAKGSPFSNVSG